MTKITDIKLTKTSYQIEDLLDDDIKKIIFVGRSNVGKSSLLNKVLNRKKLARISSRPGKTISINYYLINNEYYFVDLPGYGYAKISKKESQRVKSLIDFFFNRVKNVTLILLLIDSRRGFMNSDLEILSQIVDKKFRILTVLTKSDKIKHSELHNQKNILQQKFDLKAIPFSIKSNTDRELLFKYISQALKE